ncbi:MAG: hypothetical protein DRJ49_00155 [Thermoprotei archaeon]|nr:MAG: hypothetical protein DRJ49_00155 [Thermoprotei archaeon]
MKFKPRREQNKYIEIVSPENSDLDLLTYGELILSRDREYMLNTSDKEFMICSYSGRGIIEIGGSEYRLGEHDMIYVPRRHKVRFIGVDTVHFALSSAPSNIDTEPVLIPFRSIVEDRRRHRIVGEESSLREVFDMITEDVKASRILAGYTWVKPGNWSSWPPHDHGDTLEEFYVFYRLPKPGYGIQFVYTDPSNRRCYVVEEGDIVTIPRGFHPNVVAPGFEMKYLWVLAARRPIIDRKYGKWIYEF